jgi:hypothetical protein
MGGRVESGFELEITYFDTMKNYRFSQKLKLLGYGEFNYLTNILTLPLTYGLRLPLNEWSLTHEIFNFLNGR